MSFSATTALAALAVLLLLFVSGGVLYLSSVEWRDRRRRQAAPGAAAQPLRASKSRTKASSAQRL